MKEVNNNENGSLVKMKEEQEGYIHKNRIKSN